MKSISLALLPVLAGIGSAMPVGMAKRQENLDLDILQFALTVNHFMYACLDTMLTVSQLEHLENVFYKEALQRFSSADFQAAGFDQAFFDNMLFIAQDEQKHVTLLEGALAAAGATPVKPCTYNFGITDINSFVTTSTILEGVGTSAYLGGAPLLQDKDILTTAGAILVTEALHTSQQRLAVGEVPAPTDLGTPIDANSIFTLASGFIVECPADNTPLPFKANPGLAVDTAAAACPAAASAVLFKRTEHEAAPAAAPAPASEAAPAHEAPAGLVGPEVVASQAHPASPEEMAAAEAHVQQMAAAAHELEMQKQQMMADHEVQQFQHQAQMLHDKFGPAFNGVLQHANVVGNGKVEAARPCPFLSEGAAVTFNADAAIPEGSFVSFVSGLSVVSMPATISGQQATAAVPAGVAGQVYTFITNRSIDDNKLAADAIAFGPAIVEGETTPLMSCKHC
jgi:hypothetical protein